MKFDVLTIANLLISNGIIIWMALWLIKRVDKVDERLGRHETRLSVAEKEIEYAHLQSVKNTDN
ncbi:MAG: hypothetical protein AAFZ92_02725 [Pseudomonadota bacterium]